MTTHYAGPALHAALTPVADETAPVGDLAVATPTAEKLTQSRRSCRRILGLDTHQWTYLNPTRAQYEEVRRLINEGEGILGEVGAKKEDVCDRVCPRCLTAESRMAGYIQALKQARGERTTPEELT